MNNADFDALVLALQTEGFDEHGVSPNGSLILGLTYVRSVALADFHAQHAAHRESILRKREIVGKHIFATDFTETASVVVAATNAITRRLSLLTGEDRIGPIQFSQLLLQLQAEGFTADGESPFATMSASFEHLTHVTLADFLDGHVVRRESLLRAYPLIGKHHADLAFADVEKVIAATTRAISHLLASPDDHQS